MRPEQDQDSTSAEAESAIARHRLALQERFPLPDLPPRPARRKGRTAAVAVVLLTASAALLWLDPAYRTDRLATAAGERSTALLADGSTLSLNTDTELQVAWHLRSRRVTLERGQALFDVSHARWRPFTVDAGDTRVSVVGTLFEVWRKAQTVRVTVLRGKVRVENAGAMEAPVLLGANQQVDSAGAGLSPVVQVDAGARTAWKDGKLVFDRTPLADALAELRRYTRAGIAEPDPQVASLLVSGVFDIARADAIVELLPGILPVAVARNERGEMVVRRLPAQKK
ncbi:FecR family protein [Herbaspirillum robiniae]|uniref:Iron dicitrate transport regulator FecR n=1 Tax=Herbaspirillum robiniae TaxID=2014887 RepID=A0ABX2LZU4_9BURK|nr:FecR domain-containing protein [Herbaspirillum robiniae]NUU01119.1 iron dicitrate transport regulator FecR [Herbaspirillum robiniae]